MCIYAYYVMFDTFSYVEFARGRANIRNLIDYENKNRVDLCFHADSAGFENSIQFYYIIFHCIRRACVFR